MRVRAYVCAWQRVVPNSLQAPGINQYPILCENSGKPHSQTAGEMAWERVYTLALLKQIPHSVPTTSTSEFHHCLGMWLATDSFCSFDVKGRRVVSWEGVGSVGITQLLYGNVQPIRAGLDHMTQDPGCTKSITHGNSV